jgi:sugar phosphate isomerase/epimerase
MRLAGHTYAFRDRPLEEALDELKRVGFERVEVWLGHASRGPSAVADALGERELEPAAVSAGGFYEGGGASPEQAFELAVEIGAPCLVACVAPSRLPEIARHVPAGLVLCVENHWDQPVATPRDVLRVLGGLRHVAACLDTGHALLAGVRPDRFARLLGPRLAHVHLKDARSPALRERLLGKRLRRRLLAKPAPAFPGRGALDLHAFAATLARIGYGGTVTLEDEGANAAAALAQLERDWVGASRRSSDASAAGFASGSPSLRGVEPNGLELRRRGRR